MMGKPKAPEAPKAPEPVRIPSPEDPELLDARRRKVRAEFSARRGRASTQMTGDDGAAYTRTTLG